MLATQWRIQVWHLGSLQTFRTCCWRNLKWLNLLAIQVCVEIFQKRAFLWLGSMLFRRLASLADKFLVISLSLEKPSTTGEVLGSEDFIAFTCFQKEQMFTLRSVVPSPLLSSESGVTTTLSSTASQSLSNGGGGLFWCSLHLFCTVLSNIKWN